MAETTIYSPLEWGVSSLTLAGETQCGDQHLVDFFDQGALVAVVDGVGHGDKAALVARAATATLAERPHEPPALLLERCHRALRGTRGVVMSLASFDTQRNSMTWLGVGNVEGVLLRADALMPRINAQGQAILFTEGMSREARESVLLRGGIVGYQLPTLRPVTVPVKPDDLLIFATDGVRSAFTRMLPLSDSPQEMADHIMAEHRRGTDDALVLVARYRGAAHG